MPPHRAFDPWTFLATCGGLGLVPFAPGTFGTLAGIPLALATGAAATWLAGLIGGVDPVGTAVIEALLLVPVVAAGVPICTRAAAGLGLGKDPGPIVFDEAAALPLVLLVVPPAARTPAMLAAAFALFRLFDITKPFPCRRLEALPTGFGIMADDQAAAVWAAACLGLLRCLVAVGPPAG
jgi:phosphatidylglycerophosphatase A